MRIFDVMGVHVGTAGSDAEAVRWWTQNGEMGDYLEDTGELLSELAEDLGLDD